MLNLNGAMIKTPEELEEAIQFFDEYTKNCFRAEFYGTPMPTKALTSEEKDKSKYEKRAKVKDSIMADMATENMSRVRSGQWSVVDLKNLTQDKQLKLVLDDINTLSFELAVEKLMLINNPILTAEIKQSWINKLMAHFYPNG